MINLTEEEIKNKIINFEYNDNAMKYNSGNVIVNSIEIDEEEEVVRASISLIYDMENRSLIYDDCEYTFEIYDDCVYTFEFLGISIRRKLCETDKAWLEGIIDNDYADEVIEWIEYNKMIFDEVDDNYNEYRNEEE